MKNKSAKKSVEVSEAPTKEKKGARVANIVINVVLVVAILIAAFCTYVSFVTSSGHGVPSVFGTQMLSVQTNSMYPTIKEGDLIFDKQVKDSEELKIDDIITYWTVIDGERVLNTHRIIEIYDGGEYRIFQTKGDNVDTEDPMTVHESEIVGKYTGKKIGGLGKVFDFLQTSKGFLIVVVIPVALFFLFHLVQFFRVLFEYQKVKNRLAFEMERDGEDDGADTGVVPDRDEERRRLEEELREKLKKELLEEKEKADAEKAEAEAKAAEERAALEAELREKIRKEMEEEKGTEAAEQGDAPSSEGE